MRMEIPVGGRGRGCVAFESVEVCCIWGEDTVTWPMFSTFPVFNEVRRFVKGRKIDRLQWILETVTCAIQSKNEVQRK
jgi:hypothetical protein